MWLIETPPYRERFAELKRFARFDQEDASWLLKLREHARPRFEAIARAFYERAREHQEAHAVFQDDAQIERLHVSLVDWMERILTGPHDDAYCDISMRIGQAHVRVGLPQRYMFGGMNVVRQHMRTLIEERMPEHAHRVGLALDRILDVELALMNETYRDAYVTRLQRMAEDQPVASRREQLHVAAVELAGVLIVGLDADGYIQLFNHEAERITGYAADVVRSKRFADMFVEADACGFSEAWQSVLESETDDTVSVPTRCAIRTRSGKLRDLHGHLTRTPRVAGGRTNVFIIGRDVTDEKALEARVRRTEKLAAVGTLAAGLAHEIRNPLNGAQLHLTYLNRALAKHDAHEELNEAVDIVTSEIQRLSELVTDFLEFARPRGLRRQSVSIQALCIRSKDLLATDSTGRVSVELDMPDAEVIAEVDPDMIEQVLLNLLTNAVQAVKGNDNGGKVTLRVRRRPRQVTLAVIDDGPGLPDESAPIFDAFYSSKATGTGLGLSIVHRIVTDHGGAIAVDSKPGCTCFELTLPLIDPERTHTGAPPPIHTSTRT